MSRVLKYLMLNWFSGAVPWPWSPQGCPRFPTTCAPKLLTDPPLPATTGGSGSATDTQKTHRWKHTGGTISDYICFLTRGFCVCVCLRAARRSGERRQLAVRRQSVREKSRRPSQERFGHSDHLCVQGLGVLRYRHTPLTPAVVSQLHRSHRFRQSQSQDVLEF